jgi:hypothetical protein
MSFLPGMMPGWSRGSAAFNPLSAFSGGENGFIFDPSDLSSIFQGITGGSAAVTADADPVGYITDLTGNGHHASASAADTTRALYKTSGGLHWLEFDGSNDKYGVIPGTLLNNKAGCTLIFAGRGAADGVQRTMLLLSVGTISTSSRVYLGKTTGNNYRVGGRREDAVFGTIITGTGLFNATDKVVQTDYLWTSSDLNLYANNTIDTANTSFNTDGNTSSTNPLGIALGNNNGGAEFWLGRLYWMMLIDRVLTSTERANYTTYAGAKMGLSL